MQWKGGKMFNHQIFMIGYGSVAQCLLPVLIQKFALPHQITLMDSLPYQNKLQPFINQGVTFIQKKITPENYVEILNQFLSPNDLLIDLSSMVDSLSLIKWCDEYHVMYINAAIEEWEIVDLKQFDESVTLYNRHRQVEDYFATKQTKHPSILVEHGANPGIVSHLVKKGLIELGTELLRKGLGTLRLEEFLMTENFPELARELEIKVIHISERDTQVSMRPKMPNEFVNTWSVMGLYEESLHPAEMGWGTHETILPEDTFFNQDNPNCVWMRRSGKNVWVKSWVPHQAIIGMAITHGEAISISKHLSIHHGKQCVYCPTVHYAYCPTDYTIASLHEMEMNSLKLQSNFRIMTDDIIAGQDVLGVLLMGNPHMSWWTGSLLDIHQSRNLIANQSATTVQVAGGIFSALMWMKNNPNGGLLYPDDLPWHEILQEAEVYWGGFYSTETDWTPHHLMTSPFEKNCKEISWQFHDFMVKP